MGILSWDKPEKVHDYVGKYGSNMSDEDMEKWKAKIVNRNKNPRIEIRKIMNGTNVKLMITTGAKITRRPYDSSEGFNIHLALNGTCKMTFRDYEEMLEAIEEARALMEQVL